MEESMAPFPDHAPDYVPAYADYLSQSRGDSPSSNGPVYDQEQPIWVNRRSGDSRSNKRKPADMGELQRNANTLGLLSLELLITNHSIS